MTILYFFISLKLKFKATFDSAIVVTIAEFKNVDSSLIKGLLHSVAKYGMQPSHYCKHLF